MPDDGVAGKLRAAFELSPTILTVTGLDDGCVIEVNDAFLRATGYSRDEVIGRAVLDIGVWVDPELREQGLAALRQGLPVRDVEARFRTKNGDELVAIASADVVSVDGRPCILTALADITARVRAEAALRESQQLLTQAFNANPLPMSITSLSDGRHLEVNEAALRHSGYTRDEMLGRTKLDLGFWVAPQERERLLQMLRTRGRVRDLEVTFRTKAGEERLLLANSEVITYRGEPAVLSVSLDITDRKRSAEREQRARAAAEAASRAKDEFMALLSHELRTPLNAVYGWARMLSTGALEGEVATRALDAIVRNARAQVQLIDDMLDISRIVAGKMRLEVRPVDLKAVIEAALDAVRPAADAREIRLHSVLDTRAIGISGDPDRLQQVVWNLLTNAVKFTPRGGRVHVHLHRVNSHVEIVVSDTGQGISPELLPHVFERFHQATSTSTPRYEGLGLGLALVRHLVELHGGTVTAHSAGKDRGATFTVSLPIASILPPDEADAPSSQPRVHPTAPTLRGIPVPSLDGLRVLIVDDDRDGLALAGTILSDAGADTRTCDSATEAIQVLQRWRPDVLISDIEMPGEDGYALVRKVRALDAQRGGKTPAVALTAYGRVEDRLRALTAGFNMHVPKPVEPAELATVVASLAGRPSETM
jgi:PAS domain S-box-containing protein